MVISPKKVLPTSPVPSAFDAPTCRNEGLHGGSNSPKIPWQPSLLHRFQRRLLSFAADAYPETTENQPDSTENRVPNVFPNLYINPILMDLLADEPRAGPVLPPRLPLSEVPTVCEVNPKLIKELRRRIQNITRITHAAREFLVELRHDAAAKALLEISGAREQVDVATAMRHLLDLAYSKESLDLLVPLLYTSLPDDWKSAWSKAVKIRNDEHCVLAGLNGSIQAAHIFPNEVIGGREYSAFWAMVAIVFGPDAVRQLIRKLRLEMSRPKPRRSRMGSPLTAGCNWFWDSGFDFCSADEASITGELFLGQPTARWRRRQSFRPEIPGKPPSRYSQRLRA